jgi:carbon storage regulator CsrA
MKRVLYPYDNFKYEGNKNMLVLSRQMNESVDFYNEKGERLVRIKLLRLGLKSIRIGIEADKNIKILRDELERKEK